MMVTPSGIRSSEPGPLLITSGSAPKSAATVVIMIGRKRKQAGLPDRLRRRHALVPLRIDGEVDHDDGVLLHDAHEQDDADQAR